MDPGFYRDRKQKPSCSRQNARRTSADSRELLIQFNVDSNIDIVDQTQIILQYKIKKRYFNIPYSKYLDNYLEKEKE